MEIKEDMKVSTRKRKPLIILLKVIIGIIIAIGLFIATVFIVNVVYTKLEQEELEQYGQLIPVDGKNMNVTIQGDGEETVVLLPGFGTVSPALDFTPLVEELSPFYKVVVIEPFGYGLSDGTEKERNTENIVNEIHQVLQELKINRYILMGHSIAGIYGLEYVNKYEHEVSAFVGIDTSVPTQSGMDKEFPIGTFKLLKETGLGRLLMKLEGSPYAELSSYDDQTKEQLKIIALKNMYNSTILNEMENIHANFKNAENLTFPKNLPLIFFLQADNEAMEEWIPLHEEQVKNSIHGKIIKLDAGHYLHHTKSKEISENVRGFIEEVPPTF
ncbi:alpha/beta fold hydrolase [Priestia taiwanensis]|uniref:Alpha/beta hydrolase n=1 Tax=Priestia taiwanensis TaxID=1347902 RepID=A0A917AP07_9BACI|nr:alpha/beta hydrolase [Priestia taiwanensis]MBM7362747.1 pimeloyl-ACP methyl ester carboxylesterase [Priestia taiwanensis]GGE64753.1 alpha/beta hydrolase [Priestia taiwanensis]